MSDKKVQKESNDTIIYILTAVLVVAVIIATVVVSVTGNKGTGAATDATGETTETVVEADSEFPSWVQNSPALAQIQAFVADVCNPESPNYVEPADRIATFDMDGTIMCEKAPIYVDWMLTAYRVLDDPSYPATEEERTNMQIMRDHALTYGEVFYTEAPNKDTLVASAFAGMTQQQFRDYVVNFVDNTAVAGFSGMTYGQSFYKPMIEIIDYLRANDFDVWMVSACEREVVRALVARFDIPLDHVVATDPILRSTGQGENPGTEYNAGSDEEVILWAPLGDECGKLNKTLAIAREIGKHPIIAFGNSSGDYSMLNYAQGNPLHRGMGVFIIADDEVREYGSYAKGQEGQAVVAQSGWVGVSMATDWATIYGDGVAKTSLPLAPAPEVPVEVVEGAPADVAEVPADQIAEAPVEQVAEAPAEEYAEAA